MYHIDRVLRNSNRIQDNGIHELYVNIKGSDEGIVTELMQYIKDSNGYNEKFPKISKRVEQIKENSKEVQDMSGAWEKYIEEGRAEGRAEGEAKGRSEVLKVLGISEEEYQKKLNAAKDVQ